MLIYAYVGLCMHMLYAYVCLYMLIYAYVCFTQSYYCNILHTSYIVELLSQLFTLCRHLPLRGSTCF